MEKIYLDNAATTRIRESVIAKIHEALVDYGNPSSTHSFGRSARSQVEAVRKSVAAYMNAHPSEIIFTSGGTEADNMILRRAVRDLGVDTLVTTNIEHHAVLHTAEALRDEEGINLWFLDLDADGNPDLDQLEELLGQTQGKALVSLMHVNNEVGNILDLPRAVAIAKAHGAWFHSDAVQSIGHYPWDVKALPVDFLSASAHKFHGPKGIGFAYVRRKSGLRGMLSGGGQERGVRAGTEAFHDIVGLGEAFRAANDNLETEMAYVKELKRHFIATISRELPGVEFNGLSGTMEGSTYSLVNVRLPIKGEKAMMLLFHLDLKGIACSKGSACQSGADVGSHVLAQILPTGEQEKPSVRFSFSIYNTKDELDRVVAVLKELV